MNFFAKLEKKYSKYAIKNLMTYIIALYAFGFILNLFYTGIYDRYLSLDFAYIFKGQIWRLFTFIIQPPSDSLIFVIFSLYFYYLIGTVLERIWGAFKFNVYFFSGVILNILASLIIFLIWGVSFKLSTHYINLALFMAFAFEQPDMQVLLFFILPIKIKWLAYIDGFVFALTIIFGFLLPPLAFSGVDFALTSWYSLYQAGILSGSAIGCFANATAALVSMLNFILYFFIFRNSRPKSATQKNFNKAMKTAKKAAKANEEKKKFSLNETIYNANSEKTTWDTANKPYSKINPGAAKHRCAVCNRTELDDENLTFRYCSKCEGDYEYCSEHLYTHIHVTK